MEDIIDLTDCDTRVEILKPDNTKVIQNCEIIDEENGIVVIDLTSQCLSAIGEVVCELVIQSGTQVLYSPRITYTVVDNLFDEVDFVSTDEYPILNQLIEKVKNVEKNETTRVENEEQRVNEFEIIKKDYESYRNVMISESNVASLQNNINTKIEDVTISENVLTFIANSQIKKKITLPTSINGGSSGSGVNGREIELQKGETHIQWRYAGDEEWKNLVALSDLKGSQGEKGADGQQGLQGERGNDGKSAYQIALENNFVGSQEEWLKSLK